MGDDTDDQIPAADANTAWAIISLLLSGMLVWGGIGWLVDRWLKTSYLLAFGVLLGAVAALYLVVRRYGTFTGSATRGNSSTSSKTSTQYPTIPPDANSNETQSAKKAN